MSISPEMYFFLYVFRLSACGEFHRSVPVHLRGPQRIVCQDGFVVLLRCALLMLRIYVLQRVYFTNGADQGCIKMKRYKTKC